MDETKLPKWARERLGDLRRKIDSLESDVVRLSNACPPSRISYNDFPGSNPVFIPEHHGVVFCFSDHSITFSLRENPAEPDAVYANASKRMIVMPEAANAIRIGTLP